MSNEIAVLCSELKLPSIAKHALHFSQECTKQGQEPLLFLRDLLALEVRERKERRAQRRLKEAGFPIVKTLEGFNFGAAPHLPEALIRNLSQGQYLDEARPIIFIGEPGTGKTHIATALGACAAEQGHSVRFVTTASLVTELIEAKDSYHLNRVVAKYSRMELLILDEFGYLPLAKGDAELLFRVLSERQERRAIIITTNLPFGEWTSMFSDKRLCRAIVDRLTHNAHIIETGIKSMRLQQTLKTRSKKGG